MATLRMTIQKSGAVSFLSHLDYVEALQRALRRSGLPVAYSLGFNPHMKVSFGAALAVGVSSESEWVDVEMTEFLSESKIIEKLTPMMPEGMNIGKVFLFEEKPKSLSGLIEAGSYEAIWDCNEDCSIEDLAVILKEVEAQEAIPFEIISPKRRKTMDIKHELLEAKIDECDGKLKLSFWLRLTPLGSLKPTLFIQYLESKGFLPLRKAEVLRIGLWAKDENGWKAPIA